MDGWLLPLPTAPAGLERCPGMTRVNWGVQTAAWWGPGGETVHFIRAENIQGNGEGGGPCAWLLGTYPGFGTDKIPLFCVYVCALWVSECSF